ncbi:Hypothetical protein CFV354_0460 [Campylobacter fetus subsp. venerealis NCTC 10354]|nr:Hypothetical protein CFV354_0460 [Campylobacter fetus subsp. venerealis NCTC 10354]
MAKTISKTITSDLKLNTYSNLYDPTCSGLLSLNLFKFKYSFYQLLKKYSV